MTRRRPTRRARRGVRARERLAAQADDAERRGCQDVAFSTVEDVTFTAKDGNVVNGLLAKPANAPAGKLPTDALHSRRARTGRTTTASTARARFSPRNGYAVLQMNYRGSSGRGQQVPEGDLRRLGQPRSGGSARRRRRRDQGRRRRSGPARHLRLELRRDPDGLHDRERHALQGGHLGRQPRAAAHDVRRRPVHRAVRHRDGAAVEEPGRCG